MWIQVEDTIRDHDKIFKLSDTLGVSDAHAIGLMVCLWVWASSNAPDGDLTNFPPRAIAAAAKWDKTGAKSAGRFYDALLEARLLERLEDGRIVIRNWDKHASLIMDYIDQQREKTNARVKRYRERKKSKKTAPELSESVTRNVSQSQGCNVSVTLQNGDVTPIPYQTIPNHTNNTINAATIPVCTDMSGQEEALRRVCDEFAGAIHAPSAKEREQLRLLLEEYEPSALSAVIQEARGKGRSPAYLRKILEAWSTSGGDPARDGVPARPSYDIEAYERFSRQALMETEGGDPGEDRACDPG